ncbi:MAG: twin-arginine translocase subunit TatB [Desulfovibrionaceae bacterium]|nr:MAG: twin-arginine translocase subunit TatB [Desulfovibrionaceae bacterium]
MFGIGSTELLVILVVALLVLGPKNLPKIAQTLGRAMGEFRKVSTEFQRTLNTEIAFEEEAEKHAKAKKEQEAVQARENKPVKAETSAAPEAPSSATPAGTAPSATETGNAKPEEKA